MTFYHSFPEDQTILYSQESKDQEKLSTIDTFLNAFFTEKQKETNYLESTKNMTDKTKYTVQNTQTIIPFITSSNGSEQLIHFQLNKENKKNILFSSICNIHNNCMTTNINLISNQIVKLVKKRAECKFLQYLIENIPEEMSVLLVNKYFFPKIYNNNENAYDVITNMFGNYFIQKIIPYLNYNNLNLLTILVAKKLLPLCLNSHGTRVVQLLITNIKNYDDLLSLITDKLKSILHLLIFDLSGSFIIIHYVIEISDNNFIYEFIYENIVLICIKKYSCSALQKLIDIANEDQKLLLFQFIINNIKQIIIYHCGSFVIQFIMNKKIFEVNDKILKCLIDNIVFYCKQKFSSTIIEKCFDLCSKNMVDKLINILINDNIIKNLIFDLYGNYVIQKMLVVTKQNNLTFCKNKILFVILKELNNIMKLPFGKKLIVKIFSVCPEAHFFYFNNYSYKITGDKI